MSFAFLMTLTVIEVVLFVLVLGIYLRVVTRQLRSIAANLAKVAFGVRAVEEQVTIGSEVRELNQLMSELSDQDLPNLAQRAERAAG
jgi:signal transduction histidine kinase